MSTSPAPLRPVGIAVIDGALRARELVDTDSVLDQLDVELSAADPEAA